MKIGYVLPSQLTESLDLRARTYLPLAEDEVGITVLISTSTTRRDGKRVVYRDTVHFTEEQVHAIEHAMGVEGLPLREQVARLIKDNVVAALTEATRKREKE